MMWADRLNDQRHNISSVVSLCMVALIWLMTQSILPMQRSLPEEPMELSLLTPEPVRPMVQPPAPPPPVQPPKPVLTPSKPTPAFSPPPVLSAPSAVAPATATPMPATPSEPAKAEITRSIQAAPAVPQAVAEPAKPPPPPSSAAVENAYVVSVRTLLNANKRYPTGREASLQRPSGKAMVWFVLNRNGSLQEAGIEDTSNSILLDNAALSTVRRTNYTPWPEGSWPGQAQHRFTVTLDFAPLN
jgi:periplasmic protein TonB